MYPILPLFYPLVNTGSKVDVTGSRTSVIDNELLDMAKEYSEGHSQFAVPLTSIYQKDVLVPQYYDMSYRTGFEQLKAKWGFCEISLGDLIERGIIEIQGGHGSPSNDLRNGTIPYVKVSDIRNLRINVNPTNLIPIELARRFWKTNDGRSNLKGWDLLSWQLNNHEKGLPGIGKSSRISV